MKNKVIESLYRAIQKKDTASILKAGDEVLSYLKKYSGKYKPNGVLHKILMIEWQAKDIPERDKAIIQSAINYISCFLKLIEKNNEYIEAYISNLKTGIADLKPTICRIDKNIDFDFLLANVNIQETSFQHKTVEFLFYQNTLPPQTSKHQIDHVAIPFLRTILESKIKRIFGIDILRDSKNNAIDLSELLKILPELTTITLHKAFTPSTLSMILKWLNHFMHRNIRPEAYILHQVLQYVEPIFKPDRITHEEGVLFSINSSAFTKNIENYHKEVEDILKIKFPDCYIQWSRKEVSNIKRKKI